MDANAKELNFMVAINGGKTKIWSVVIHVTFSFIVHHAVMICVKNAMNSMVIRIMDINCNSLNLHKLTKCTGLIIQSGYATK